MVHVFVCILQKTMIELLRTTVASIETEFKLYLPDIIPHMLKVFICDKSPHRTIIKEVRYKLQNWWQIIIIIIFIRKQVAGSYIKNQTEFRLPYQSSQSEFPQNSKWGISPEVKEEEIFNPLEGIDIHKATSSADFASWISKNSSHILCEPVSHLINSILFSDRYLRL